MTWRLGGAVAGAAVLVVITAFAAAGPLRPGWSRRAGTSSALLAQLSGSASASYSSAPPVDHALHLPPRPPRASRAPPSRRPCRERSPPHPPMVDGDAEVTLSMQPADTTVPLVVRIIGPAVNGGVALHRSEVTFGQLSGQVTALDGSTIGAFVTGPTGSLNLTMNLSLNSGAGTLTGQLSGSAAQ